MPQLKPAQPAPELKLNLLNGNHFELHQQPIRKLFMLVVYRGLHCPVCRGYLRQLERLLADYGALGVDVLAVSADPEERARKAQSDWGLDRLTIAWGLNETQMRAWDLYVSDAIKDAETARFAEPALFLIDPNYQLYYSALSSLPFGRPDLAQFKGSVKWVLENDYPARGEI